MPVEAVFWTLLLLLAPVLTARYWATLGERFARIAPELEALAPWVHGVGIPYLAVILGSVSGRQVGLQGNSLERWFTSILACGISLSAAYFLRRRITSPLDPERTFQAALLDEVRWAFYRGVAALWLPFPFSALPGLGLAWVEQSLTHVIAEGWRPPTPQYWKTVLRAALSALIFALTRNFWITTATQMLLTVHLAAQPGQGRTDHANA